MDKVFWLTEALIFLFWMPLAIIFNIHYVVYIVGLICIIIFYIVGNKLDDMGVKI